MSAKTGFVGAPVFHSIFDPIFVDFSTFWAPSGRKKSKKWRSGKSPKKHSKKNFEKKGRDEALAAKKREKRAHDAGPAECAGPAGRFGGVHIILQKSCMQRIYAEILHAKVLCKNLFLIQHACSGCGGLLTLRASRRGHWRLGGLDAWRLRGSENLAKTG